MPLSRKLSIKKIDVFCVDDVNGTKKQSHYTSGNAFRSLKIIWSS